MLTEIKRLPVKGHTMVRPTELSVSSTRAIFGNNGTRDIGRVAQLGERGVRNAEVEGSNPFASTKEQRVLQPSERRIAKPSTDHLLRRSKPAL